MSAAPPVAERAADDVPRRLAQILAPRAEARVDVRPLSADAEPPRRVAAVDGSSAIIADARAFVLGAYRAGGVRVDASGDARRDAPDASVALLEKGRAADAVRDALRAVGVADASVDERVHLESALGHLRAIAELAAARRALADLSEGDLLLIDGPLRAREPDAPRAAVDALAAEAASRGVRLVGVCKSTSQTVDGFPALAVAHRASRAAGLDVWAAELPPPPGGLARVFAARLNAAEQRVFRFDVSARDPEPLATLAAVASLAGHPAYPGYPSPLAMAHNAVLLDEATQRELLQRVRRAAEDAGADAALWDLAFVDYHDVLELGV